MDLTETDSFLDAKPYWEELNRTYKHGELSLDWEIHNQFWEQFYKDKGYLSKILIGIEKRKCVGIIPFKYHPSGNESQKSWIFGEETIIAREYFSPPSKIHQFLPYFPDHNNTDLSCFYKPFITHSFVRQPGSIIDIKSSEDAYYESLTKKRRSALRKNARENSDITVKISHHINENEIAEITEKYIDYWLLKNALNGKLAEVDSREKIEMDLLLLKRAEEFGKLIVLYFYDNAKLIAVNFSVRREKDRVDDYLCLRDTDEKYAHRGIGIYAIIKNIEYCRTLGIRYYDLSDFVSDYKRKFINTEMFYYTYSSRPPMADTLPSDFSETEQVIQSEIIQKVF